MKLETPRLDEFVQITRLPGTEVNFTVKLPDNSIKTINVNDLFADIHAALHSLHHFMDPGGAHHTGYPVIVRHVTADENPTGQAMIGSP